MRTRFLHALLGGAACVLAMLAGPAAGADRPRILVVSSYHPEYLWSMDTSAGFNAAMLELGWLDDEAQAEQFLRTHRVTSSRVELLKLWMDTKRRNSRADLARAVARVVQQAERFQPDLIMLGDDNATNYVGSYYLDTRLPLVFWGVNGDPTRYSLVDTLQRPGHNVTGVYQAGYLKEGIDWLRRLLPGVTRMAVLADDSPTSRAKVKEIDRLARSGALQVQIIERVVTNSFEEWKYGALAASERVDAFFVLNHNTLRDATGNAVDQLEAGSWYLANVRKPDISHERQFVVEGVLCAVDDSGFKQAYEAVQLAWRILAGGETPGDIPIRAPTRGEFVVNVERARMLGLEQLIDTSALVEERIPTALALASGP